MDLEFTIGNVYKAWSDFRRGKRKTAELQQFSYALERELYALLRDLEERKYVHGGYLSFEKNENKRRTISVAPMRDRVVHRLLYDFLVLVYDKTFCFDAWSCRKEKGLLGAIERVAGFARRYPRAYVWRADIKKFFDSVSTEKLVALLERKITGNALWLAKSITDSYSSRVCERERERERE